MKKIMLGSRSDRPAFFDMSCRWRDDTWYLSPKLRINDKLGRGFKIGDKAAAYVFLVHWRKNFPNRRLVVIDDPFLRESAFSKEIPLDLLFENIADEIWIADEPRENLQEPEGQPLYLNSLWDWWNLIGRDNLKSLNIKNETIVKIKAEVEIPNENFATIIPVFNKTIHISRNIPIDYWLELIDLVAKRIPLVVISKDGFPEPDVGEFFEDLDIWSVFSLLKNSKLHISGETGLTLWAPILGTCTVAFYNDPVLSPCRPLEFDRSVMIFSKDHPVQDAAQKIVELYEYEKRSSFSSMHL